MEKKCIATTYTYSLKKKYDNVVYEALLDKVTNGQDPIYLFKEIKENGNLITEQAKKDIISHILLAEFKMN